MINCIFENGGRASLRHVVIDAIVIKDNNLLMVKRSDNLVQGGKWALIGGFAERNETTREALSREVFEETGYKIKTSNLFTIIDIPNRKNEDRQNIAFVYICEVGEKEGLADSESTKQEWFDLGNLPKEEEIAFDHYQVINLFLMHKNDKFSKLVNY
jgi:8-oxo-dGTP diphosphatase